MKNTTENLISLYQAQLWSKILEKYEPINIVNLLSFEDALRLAYLLLYNHEWDDDLQNYAVDILKEIRTKFSTKWNSTWEYDALMGMACNITCRHEERYEAYREAFKKAVNPPPGLYIEFARCSICPGVPPISYDQAIELVKKALETAPYADGIGLLSHLYSLKDDEKQEKYWNKLLKESDSNFYSPSIDPEFLSQEYLEKSYLQS